MVKPGTPSTAALHVPFLCQEPKIELVRLSQPATELGVPFVVYHLDSPVPFCSGHTGTPIVPVVIIRVL
jgi:hypothetical protein